MDNSALTMEGQVVIGAIASFLIQKLKAFPWLPWIHQGTPNMNKALSALIAFATAAGFTFGYSGTFDSGYVITLTTPPVDLLIRFGFAYITQQGSYHLYVKQEMPIPLLSHKEDAQ